MSIAFVALAIALVGLALAFLLLPLLRDGGDARLAALQRARAGGVLDEAEYQAKRAALLAEGEAAAAAPRARLPALVLAILVPLAALALYAWVGEPRGLGVGPEDSRMAREAQAAPADGEAPDLATAIEGLAQRLEQEPDDPAGWMLLGRAYKTMQRFAEARDAFDRAHALLPNDADVMVELAESTVLASDDRRIAGRPAELLAQALERVPLHPRALWLEGIRLTQEERHAEAADTWQRLLDSLPADAEIRGSLSRQIAEARARAGQPLPEGATPAAPAVATAPGTPPPATGDSDGAAAALTVRVDITPELAARLAATDVLFVFARAPSGPRMPVAIQRLPASGFPLEVRLDDSMAMMPQLTLSSLPEVVVGARVSKSGNATPQPGDFEAISAPLSPTAAGAIELTIDRVLP